MDYGVILDFETTGTDPEKDHVIEIGLLEFAMDEAGKISILNLYGALEDPKQALSPEIIQLTGLTDAVLAGQSIDWDFVRKKLAQASVVIAHNAAFDRSFLEKRPEIEGLSLHWACSFKHIDWEAKGFRTRALNYLAADHGFLNPFAHRALFDCATTLRLVEPYFAELLERSYLREFRILTHKSPFETKDKLRLQRYRWDADLRVWFKDVFEDQLLRERAFLAEEIYKGIPDFHEEKPLS